MRRRSFLALAGLAGLGLAGCDAPKSDAGPPVLSRRLRIPPLLEPEPDSDGIRRFTLTLRSGRSEFLPGKVTPTWGVNRAYLGPTLRAARGDEIEMRVVNRLDESALLHWHGLRLPAEFNGSPRDPIEPGESARARWRIEQSAAPTWYRPGGIGDAEKHLYRGVAGLFLLEDGYSEGLDLPDRYGVDDIPLILQDKSFGKSGALVEDAELADPARGEEFGLIGDKLLVNGTYGPAFKVTTQRVRFRLLNASGARVYRIGFADSRRFHLISTDAGMLREPLSMDRIALSPGERAEIVVEFIAGESVKMRTFNGAQRIDEGEFEVLKLDVAAKLRRSPSVPGALAVIPLIEPAPEDRVRTFRLADDGTINGLKFDPDRIDAVVPSGAREVWEIDNQGEARGFHVQQATFRVLTVNDRGPLPHQTGPKDTVFLPAESKVRLAVRFSSHTDRKRPYVYQSGLAGQIDDGMMGQFLLVKRGTEDKVARAHGLAEAKPANQPEDQPTDQPTGQPTDKPTGQPEG